MSSLFSLPSRPGHFFRIGEEAPHEDEWLIQLGIFFFDRFQFLVQFRDFASVVGQRMFASPLDLVHIGTVILRTDPDGVIQITQRLFLRCCEDAVVQFDRTDVGDHRGVVHDFAGPVAALAFLDFVQRFADGEFVTAQARVLDGGNLAVAAGCQRSHEESEADPFDGIEGDHVKVLL
ncbi:hypothetical protein D3C71_1355980 [compost metagenome]